MLRAILLLILISIMVSSFIPAYLVNNDPRGEGKKIMYVLFTISFLSLMGCLYLVIS